MNRQPPGLAVRRAVEILRAAGLKVIVAHSADAGDWLIHAESEGRPRARVPQREGPSARLPEG